jgi:hypothetical protein
MDFNVGLPCTSHGHGSIWVIVDCLTKSAHFIPVCTRYRARNYAELYISNIVRYHGIPKTIISDRGSIFVVHFWEQLCDCLGTHLIRISGYHPQTDGQTGRVNLIVEDMLCACVLNDGPKWDQHLPLAEFSYYDSYQESLKMSPFEALYGRSYCTPLSWSESRERTIFGPDIVTEAEEKVKQIRANILIAQTRQKSYTDKQCRPFEFEVDDHVYLWVLPMKSVHRVGIKGKLAPRYVGPYPILEKFGSLAYQVELSSSLAGMHNVFHVSQLKKYMKPPTDVVVEDTILLEPDLTYKAYPVKILEQQDRVTQRKTTHFYKVQWNNHSEDEATWEREDYLQSNFLDFLPLR